MRLVIHVLMLNLSGQGSCCDLQEEQSITVPVRNTPMSESSNVNKFDCC